MFLDCHSRKRERKREKKESTLIKRERMPIRWKPGGNCSNCIVLNVSAVSRIFKLHSVYLNFFYMNTSTET